MIHIEGMGMLGSLLARKLDAGGVDFTWSDNDNPFSAWQVSTGLAYPDGDAANQQGLMRWYEELEDYSEAALAPYVFAHKNPPHGGRYAVTDYGYLRRAGVDAIAVNVPLLVENTRFLYSGSRLMGPPEGAELVVAHTTPKRGKGYLWGWVGKVTFDLPDELAADLLGQQPALYAKAHRFNLTYAYPIPGEDAWWAGSVLQNEVKPRVRSQDELESYFLGWAELASELLHIRNIGLQRLDQGWRPRAKADDTGEAELDWRGMWTLPPMPTDGVRRGHIVVDQLIEKAGWLS